MFGFMASGVLGWDQHVFGLAVKVQKSYPWKGIVKQKGAERQFWMFPRYDQAEMRIRSIEVDDKFVFSSQAHLSPTLLDKTKGSFKYLRHHNVIKSLLS